MNTDQERELSTSRVFFKQQYAQWLVNGSSR